MLNILLLVSLFISGWLLQQGGFCLVVGVRSAMDKRPGHLLLVIGVALWSGVVWLFFHVSPIYSPHGEELWLNLAGGALFGVGAALNNGCFFGSLTRLFNGDSHMFFSLLGIISASLLIPPLAPVNRHPVAVSQPVLLYLVLLAVVTTGWIRSQETSQWRSSLLLLVPGMTSGYVYSSATNWSLSRMITDIGYSVHHDDAMTDSLPGFLFFVAGMFCCRLWQGGLTFLRPKVGLVYVHFIAGWIMVAGARMMGGGNDVMLFRRLPTLTLQVFLLLLVMCLSIAITLFVIRQLLRRTPGP